MKKKIQNVVATIEQMKEALLYSSNETKVLVRDLNLPIQEEENDIKTLQAIAYIIRRYPLTFDFVLNMVNRVVSNRAFDRIEPTSYHYEINIRGRVALKYISNFPSVKTRESALYALLNRVEPISFKFEEDNRKIIFLNELPFWIRVVYDSDIGDIVVNITLNKVLWEPIIEQTYYKNGNRYVRIPANLYPFTCREDTIKNNTAYLVNILGMLKAVESKQYQTDVLTVGYDDIKGYPKIQKLLGIRYSNIETMKELEKTNEILLNAVKRYTNEGYAVRMVSGVYRNEKEKAFSFYFTKTNPFQKILI